MMFRAGIAAAIGMAITACATPAPIRAPSQLTLGDTLVANPQGNWTLIPDAYDGPTTRGAWLTRFGTELDFIWIVTDLRRGARLVEAGVDTYEGSAWTGDVEDLIDSSLSALGMYEIDFEAGLPGLFAGGEGFSLGWAARSKQGAVLSGKAYWRIFEERLTLAVTMAEVTVYRDRVDADQAATAASIMAP